MAKLITDDPLEGTAEILAAEFYGRRDGSARDPVPETPTPTLAKATKAKPTHYKVVCISLYTEDIERLEGLVAALKGRGHTKANKSAVIRFALDAVDVTKMPKGY